MLLGQHADAVAGSSLARIGGQASRSQARTPRLVSAERDREDGPSVGPAASRGHGEYWMRKKMLAALAVVVALAVAPLASFAASPTPVGTWKTIDDKTGKPRALVEVYEDGDSLDGKVIKVFPQPGKDADPVCRKCPGDLKGHKVTGLVILQDVKKHGDTWEGGTILDPESGKTYKAKVSVLDGGKRLEVRGFIGFSMFGRSQTWVREEPQEEGGA